MKALHYDEISTVIKDNDLFAGDKLLFSVCFDELKKKYDLLDNPHLSHLISEYVRFQWVKIIALLEKDWRRARILDLGCGSNGIQTVENGYLHVPGRRFNPWLCRVLYQEGIDVVGIDVGNLEGEKFEHYQADLLKNDITKLFGAKSFDLINACVLFTSPELEKRVTGRILKGGDASIEASIKLRDILMPQVKVLCKNDGYFIYKGKSLENFI